MGLDMYLNARKFVSGYRHDKSAERATYNELLTLAKAKGIADPKSPSAYVEVTAAYWRKANQIHKWFVDNAQDGVDDCGMYDVEREQLVQLRALCQQVLDSPRDAKGMLPTKEGFFFGAVAYDGNYLDDLKSTIAQLDRVLAAADDQWEFQYHSSW